MPSIRLPLPGPPARPVQMWNVTAASPDVLELGEREASGADSRQLTCPPFSLLLIEALTSQGGVNLQVPRDELPAEEWLTIKSIVRDLELEERDWNADLLAGYFCRSKLLGER